MYIIYCISLKRTLNTFPWNTDPWTFNPPVHYLNEAFIQNTIGFPHSQLRANLDSEKQDPPYSALLFLYAIIAALVKWWCHVAIWLYHKPVDTNILIWGSSIIAFIRYLFYQGPYAPPISLAGRFAIKNFIIPAYDKVRIAPILFIKINIFSASSV